MFGAIIDVIQPQINNLIAYLLPLADKKTTTAMVKCDKTSRLDGNYRQKCLRLQRMLLIRKGSIKYCILLLWARLNISCISRLYCVWNYVFVHVCKTTNWQFSIICNCINNYNWELMGRWMVGGARDGDWRQWLSSSDITLLRRSQGLVKRHSYFMQAVSTLLWTDCFETYMVVT